MLLAGSTPLSTLTGSSSKRMVTMEAQLTVPVSVKLSTGSASQRLACPSVMVPSAKSAGRLVPVPAALENVTLPFRPTS